MKRFWRLVLLAICFGYCTFGNPARAQQAGPFDVFFNSSINKGKSGLFFVNVRTGLSKVVVTNGTDHALLGDGVIFQEIGSGAIMMAYPDGRIEPYTLLQASGKNTNVNWIASSNGKRIAWAVSSTQDQSLLSDLYIAEADGSNKKLVLHTSSTKGIETFPLAITDDGRTIFYARQTRESGSYQLFAVASDVFNLNVASGQTTQLPGQSACTCAVGFSGTGRLYARLDPQASPGSFNVHLWDLSIKVDSIIKAPPLAHRQAGNLLISPNGNLVAYISARGVPPAKGVPPEAYAVIVADVARRQQDVIAAPIKVNLRPVAFAPDNSALMLVGVNGDGTYKLTFKDGNLQLVSAYSFLGTIPG